MHFKGLTRKHPLIASLARACLHCSLSIFLAILTPYIATGQTTSNPSNRSALISAKAGKSIYHLVLPKGYCTPDESIKADREFANSLKTNPPAQSQIRLSGIFSSCEELNKLRSGQRKRPWDFAFVFGRHKEKYDRSIGSSQLFGLSIICAGSVYGVKKREGLEANDYEGRIAAALNKLNSQPKFVLPGISVNTRSCSSISVAPINSAEPQKKIVMIHSEILLFDWRITHFSAAYFHDKSSIDSLLQREKALIAELSEIRAK